MGLLTSYMVKSTQRMVISSPVLLSIPENDWLFLPSGDFCRLQITYANSLDPDQDQRNVGPDLGPNRLTL